jgi:TolA-binding protein
MTVVGLHPEELLDRSARGTLSAADRAMLDAHLSTCAACRFELEVRDDFALDLEAPAGRISGSVAEALGRITAEIPVAAPAPVDPPAPLVFSPPSVRRTAGSRRLLVLLVAAAALLVGGVAGAAGLAGVMKTFSVAPAAPPPVAAPVATTTTARVARPVAAPVAPPTVAEAAPAEPLLTAEPVAPVAPVPALHATSRTADVAAPAPRPVSLAAPAPAPLDRAELAAQAERAPVPTPPDPHEAATLFSQANEARRRGDLDRAVAMYRDLERRFPDAEEAKVARATVGRLLLERGDAESALDRFDAYLSKSRGVLTEDAMVGRAESLRRLGRARDEAAAWNALLAKYPESAHASRARARLAELAPR